MVFKWLKRIFIGVVGLVLLISLLGIVLIQKPGLLINSRTLAWATKFAATEGVFVHWKNLDIQFEKTGLLSTNIRLKIQGLEVDTRDHEILANVSRLQLGVQIEAYFLGIHIKDVDPLLIESEFVKLNFPDESPNESNDPSSHSKSESTNPSWPSVISQISVGEVHIDVKKVEFLFGSFQGGGQVKVQTVDNAGPRKYLVLADAKDTDASTYQVKGNLLTADQTKIKLVDILDGTVNLTYDLNASYRQKNKLQVAAHLTGKLTPESIQVGLVGSYQNPKEAISKIEVKNCKLESIKKSGSQFKAAIRLDCPVKGALNTQVVHRDLRGKISDQLELDLQAHFETASYPIDLKSLFSGKIEAKIFPFKSTILSGSGNIKMDVSGILNDFPKNWKLETELDSQFEITHFEKVVAQLEETPFAIPAPFRSLHGRISTSIEGKGNLALFQFPYEMKTDLDSLDQRFHSSGNGLFKWKTNTDGSMELETQVDVNLSKMRIVLPKLELAALPQLFPDNRFKRNVVEKKKPSRPVVFDYEIKIHNQKGSPIQLLSNLAGKAIPIDAEIVLSSHAPPSGKVQVAGFPLTIFNKVAKLEKFNLTLVDPAKESQVDGLIALNYMSRDIFVQIHDSISKPRLKLYSVPELEEKEIIALLLYGRMPSELDSDDSKNTADTTAAVRDGSVSLLSFYILASTPVEHINYDPKSKVLSARFKLEKTTSLNVATDTSTLTSVGILKRIGTNLYIETDLNNPTNPDTLGLNTFIEWRYRH